MTKACTQVFSANPLDLPHTNTFNVRCATELAGPIPYEPKLRAATNVDNTLAIIELPTYAFRRLSDITTSKKL